MSAAFPDLLIGSIYDVQKLLSHPLRFLLLAQKLTFGDDTFGCLLKIIIRRLAGSARTVLS
jgi:hypothetical protein